MRLKKTDTKRICIGQCAGAFGVRGEVKVKSFTEVPEDIFGYGPLLDEKGVPLLIPISHRAVKNAFAVKCKDIDTREQAQELAGKKLYVRRADMPEPDEDEFYFEDLIGLEVKTTDGRRMGKVLAVHNYGAGDLLEISGHKDQPQFFHPFTKTAVPKVDIGGGRIVIDITPGHNP